MLYGLEFPFLLRRHVIAMRRFKWCYICDIYIYFSKIRYCRPQQETACSIESVRALSAGVKERHSVSRTGARELLILSVTLLLEG
jgi:hypothetical protein